MHVLCARVSINKNMQSFKIEFEPLLGRHAIASHDIHPNQVVLVSRAFSWSIADSFKKKICSKCLAVSSTFFTIKCNLCEQMYYCSESCIDPHDRLCFLLRKLATLKSPAHDKNVIKLLVMTLYNLSNIHTDKGYNHPTSLQSHYDEWPLDDKQSWTKMKKFIIPMLHQLDLESDPDAIMHWVSKIESNGFGIWGPGKDICMGRMIVPEASFFNHSCKPNLACEQDGTLMRIVALDYISKGKKYFNH
jgi:hypothetical protein